jgi:hypothetical protein
MWRRGCRRCGAWLRCCVMTGSGLMIWCKATFHQILFDLQRGDKAVKAELHDSEFSGVIVCLHH